MERVRQSGRWVWQHLHRDDESYWWLALVLGGWLGLIAAAIGLGAHALTTSWQPLIVVAALAHQLMWGIVLALVAFLSTRRWRTVFACAVLATGVATTQAPLYLSSPTIEGTPLSILQANLRVGSADPQRLVAMVREHHVDVAATEELTTGERNRLLAAGMAAELPYHFDAPLAAGGGGLAIWSRYPITAKVNYPGYELGVLSATIEIPGRPLAVVAVHLLPPYPYPSDVWTREIARLKTLLATIERTSGAVVVAGDFNATTDNGQFRNLLTNGYRDLAEEVGAGYLPTYPTDRWFPPVIAIDHVLLAGPVGPSDIRSLGLPGSDHRALLATLTR